MSVENNQLERVPWQAEAACRNPDPSNCRVDPELFFPIGDSNSNANQPQVAEAKAVCGHCPAIGYCALYARTTGQDFGIWGGMTEKERRKLEGVAYLRRAQQLQANFNNAHPDGTHLPDIVGPSEPAPKRPKQGYSQQGFRA